MIKKIIYIIGIVAAVLGILEYFNINTFTKDKYKRPLISIESIDSYFNKTSMNTKFVLNNIGKNPAYFTVDCKGFVNDQPVQMFQDKTIKDSNIIMPGQIIRYRALGIKGNTYKAILENKSKDNIVQTINIQYGPSKKTIDSFYTFQKVKLDQEKIKDISNMPFILQGLWLLKESDYK